MNDSSIGNLKKRAQTILNKEITFYKSEHKYFITFQLQRKLTLLYLMKNKLKNSFEKQYLVYNNIAKKEELIL